MTGRTISHYRILEKLGEGGMGVVYKAEDTTLKRTVALKFLAPKAVSGEKLRVRFLREAQAAGAVNHPNICPVYGIEEADGTLFIVMAYIAGTGLDRLVAARRLTLGNAVDIAVQVGEALLEAHEHGIVHRDVKSANILVTEKWRAVLTDFGLALLTDRSRITRTGTTLGTVAYISPEQALGKQVDRRTDIWSLGIVLYEMSAGELPFRGETLHEVFRSILTGTPKPLTDMRRGLSPELSRIVEKSLSKSPAERYQHMDDLLVDLRALRKRLPEEAPPPPASLPAEGPGHAAAKTVTLLHSDNSITIPTAIRDLDEAGEHGEQAGAGAGSVPSPGERSWFDRRWRILLAILVVLVCAAVAAMWRGSVNP